MTAKSVRDLARRIFAQNEAQTASQLIDRYIQNGRIPWSTGYQEYKAQYIDWVLQNPSIMQLFKDNQPLSPDYGYRIDERAVEYPWVFTRLKDQSALLLDAGSTLNQGFVLSKRLIAQKTTVIYTLSPEPVYSSSKVSYIYGDLRQTILRDKIFDEITCISTLEHIGMDNTMLYTQDKAFNESNREGYSLALQEFNRLLKPGGRLLITVPFGIPMNIKWLQQYDREELQKIVEVFAGQLVESTFYHYTQQGWQLSDMETCAQCEYYDIHSGKPFDPDYAAAARAVACLVLEK
jgi:SAM-dependent methyltransferase